MSDRNNSSAFRGLLPLAVVLLAVSAAPALAQSEPTAMQKFFGAIGLLEIPEEPIEYRERAPLVVPPSTALITPRGSDDIRQHNPDWPVDHDARRASSRDPAAQRKADEFFYSGDRVGAVELQRGRISRDEFARRDAAARKPEAETAGSAALAGNERLGPAGLGFQGWGKSKEERVVFTGEPPRRSLTEPPAGLRTPSTDAPYGIVSNRPDPNKKKVFDRSASENDPNRGR